MLRSVGIFPVRRHYYEPLFHPKDLRFPVTQERPLPGVDLDIESQTLFLETLRFEDELRAMKWSDIKGSPESFWFGNGSFESGDAEFLYQFVRATKPRTVLEIGSGHSTKIVRMALARNRDEKAEQSTHICVEPYEMPWLERLTDVTIRREQVETSSIDWATALSAGDLLFIDSSHMIRPQGDVLKEYLEIIPSLASGVFVHVHDIFIPRDYLPEWFDRDVKFWNEQYLLEVLLGNTSRYKIIAGVNFLANNRRLELSRVCPYLTEDRQPGSFYFMVK
jgi:predicted O-methyltransferase YrrM